jgi:ABC-2 type transport system ATP-binding protein
LPDWQPLSGHIRVKGLSVEEQPREVHRHLGYLSDFYGLYDRLSVMRCLQYSALSMGVRPVTWMPACGRWPPSWA